MFNRLARLLGGSNDRAIRRLKSTIDEINKLEPIFEGLADLELREKTYEFKERFKDGEELDKLLPEGFAAVRTAAKRTLGQRHFDVQLMGGIVLHEGKIAEMRTGEGKTLVATLPAYLNGLTSEGVHVVTVNDYLARRDGQWMGAIFHMLGLSVGVLQHNASYLYSPENTEPGMENLQKVDRRAAYVADITYGTNNEFGFDYLRDNMVSDISQRVQRPLAFGMVDEVDNILIDEARTPLIISGPAEDSPQEYVRFARLVPSLRDGEDYTIDEKHRTVALSTEGMAKLERTLKINNLYDSSNFRLVHFVENALKAQLIFQRDREYVVKDGEVLIVDEFTGRLMPGRRYSDGLHQAIEAKEGMNIQRETITYATITLQNYFRLYSKLAGMTGTAATEAEEFFKIYNLEVVEIPTNLSMIREDFTDLIYVDQNAKYKAITQEIGARHRAGQPVLVGTTDISKSELLSEMLNRHGIPHEILNAKQHEREANIVAEAGRLGAVTVATNMAGRGTDIVLGGNPNALNISNEQWEFDHKKVLDVGGLRIIGSERHEARRIDNQLRGRAGRQGDPGSSRFYVALDDGLMKRFGGDRIKAVMKWAGVEKDSAIENKMVSKSIEGAQTKVEAYHFDMRKHLVEYDDVVNTHRSVIYAERNKTFVGSDLKKNIQEMIEKELRDILARYVEDIIPERWDVEGLYDELASVFPLTADLLDSNTLINMEPTEIIQHILDQANILYEKRETSLTSDLMRNLERQLMIRTIDVNWVQHLTSMENLRQGIGLYAYGQRDPLVMYKKEGHEMFQGLLTRIQQDMVHSVYTLVIESSDGVRGPQALEKKTPSVGHTVMSKVLEGQPREAVSSISRNKVGRNTPCPCGSGKKYKRCHGT